MSTQQGFGLILNALARSEHAIAKRIVTTSPDVTVSTNLGSWVNRRGLYAREELIDVFRQEKIPSSYSWDYSAKGQHFELGIAEMNLFLQLSALGLSHDINGERLFPIGTVYDPFIERGLDALNYACYQDARFIIAGTPSGITLAPEGGAHQSIKTPLIGLSQPGLASFEPAYVDELAAIMAWGFDYLQRPGPAGGSVYLRLSTRPIAQAQRTAGEDFSRDVIAGGYWGRAPSPRTQVAIAYTGAVAPEAQAAAAELNAKGIETAILAITSSDRLFASWRAAQSEDRDDDAHIARLLADLPGGAKLVCVMDGHPAALAWLGAVAGHTTRTLGVDRFGESGNVAELYAAAGIDAHSIVKAAMPQPAQARRAS
jgi:pyruvate dehydrogenase E1 component